MPDAYLDGLDAGERAEMWTQFLERNPADQRLWVVTDDGAVAGFACFGATRDASDTTAAELYAINLDPAYWGRGLGRALLVAATEQLRSFGSSAHLWVVPANARARSLYESAGWVDDGGRRSDDVQGVRVDEMRYRIELAAGR